MEKPGATRATAAAGQDEAQLRCYVMGPDRGGRRYLKLLGGGAFADLPEAQRAAFVSALCRDAATISDAELAAMLRQRDWRPRLVAAWFIGIGRRVRFRAELGELLLASEVAYAGKGYAFALARFGETADAELLTRYLDHYLPLLDCPYDQPYVMSALLHVDDSLGTPFAERFVARGGMWQARYADVDPGSFLARLAHVTDLVDAAAVS